MENKKVEGEKAFYFLHENKSKKGDEKNAKKNNRKDNTMTYDKVFKGVLVSKEARRYLVSLISDITGIKKEIIRDNIVFKNNEQQINGISEKKKE